MISVYHKNDPFCNVCGMVGNSLEILDDHRLIDHVFGRNTFRLCQGDDAIDDFPKLAVDIVVSGKNILGLLYVHLDAAIESILDHLLNHGDKFVHSLYDLDIVGKILDPVGRLFDVIGLVPDSLHVLDKAEIPYDIPKIARIDFLAQKNLHAERFCLSLEQIDLIVVDFYSGVIAPILVEIVAEGDLTRIDDGIEHGIDFLVDVLDFFFDLHFLFPPVDQLNLPVI